MLSAEIFTQSTNNCYCDKSGQLCTWTGDLYHWLILAGINQAPQDQTISLSAVETGETS